MEPADNCWRLHAPDCAARFFFVYGVRDGADMENQYIRSVIILIGGAQLPGESIKRYLARVSLYTGIGYRSLCAAYYSKPGEYISRNTLEKLERAAQSAKRPDELIAYTEHHLAIWEADPARHRPWIDAGRRFVAELRVYHEGQSGRPALAGTADVGRDRGAASEAAMAASPAAPATA